jgi:tellurite resistance protein
MSFLSNLGKSIESHAKRFAPAALSPEKRFARAMITVSALLTMADGAAEESEIEQASTIIAGHRSIQQYLTPVEAHDMYALILGELKKAYTDSTTRLMEVNKRIAEISDTVKEPHWRRELIEFAGIMARSNGRGVAGDAERALEHKLAAALS